MKINAQANERFVKKERDRHLRPFFIKRGAKLISK